MKRYFIQIWKTILPFIFIFVLIHLLKDITQDILKVSSPLDVFGNIKEDTSFLPKFWQSVFYYGLGGLSFITEAFLLVAIPIVIFKKGSPKLEKWIFAGVLYLVIFIATCVLLDPRFL